MPKPGKPIPEGYTALTPSLTVSPCREAMDFYKKAFGAEERPGGMAGPDGKIMHAEMTINGAIFHLNDPMQMGPGPQWHKPPKELGGIATSFHLYVTDADALYKRAIGAGATSVMEPHDEFWGDRYAQVKDPYGFVWGIATHKLDMTPEEIREAMQKMMAGMQGKK